LYPPLETLPPPVLGRTGEVKIADKYRPIRTEGCVDAYGS
jgi:hypothetical protein